MSENSTDTATRLFIPSLRGLYSGFAKPASWVILRVMAGGLLAVEGWPKIIAPMAQTGFVESIGFHPGWLFSPLLAAIQFFGGIAIALGLFTRPAALANAVMLAITYWFHVTHPYGDAFLTKAGIEGLAGTAKDLFTPAGLQSLADGGGRFLAQVQDKAQTLSLIWPAAVLFFAGHGGGPLSVDRNILKREF